MPAFDVTTKPTTLSLKPGSTGSIIVVISNRLGRPVMGLVEGVLTPASAARWLLQPAELQRRYEADPAATVNYEFKVAVPENAPKQAAQFKASVRDVLAPDDTRAEGQTVAINVTPDVVVVTPRRKIPWWVWVVVGVVVLGVGFGIYMLVRPKGVPNVIGMTAEKASDKLKKAGFLPVIKDTIDKTADDTTVVNQEPKPKSDLPPDSLKGKAQATIVVNRLPATVPALVGEPLAFAIDRLNQAGLRAGNLSGQYTGKVSEADRIVSTAPAAGAELPRGSPVNLIIHKYSETPPTKCINVLRCVVDVDPRWTVEIQRKTEFRRIPQ